MKRFILLLIVCFTFVGCEVYDYNQYDEKYNPFFRTQWSAIDEDGTTLRTKVIIFDFLSMIFYQPTISVPHHTCDI